MKTLIISLTIFLSFIIGIFGLLISIQAQTSIKGDLNNDGKVDVIDLGILLSSWARVDRPPADLNQDGRVDIIDLGILLSNWGGTTTTTVPVTTTTILSNQPFRAFSDDSYWNIPFPPGAPIDPRSAEYIADSQNSAHSQNYLRFTAAPGTEQGFGQPIYWASSTDKLYTISDGKLTVQVHIPKNAAPATGSDRQITIFDLSTNQVVGMSGANYDSSSDKWTVGGSIDRYMLSSNGLDNRVDGSNDSRNYGHRGISTAVRAVRVDEVKAGVIRHRLACFWWATTGGHYWPMAGDEGNKGGIVPEGIVIRIKPSVDLSKKPLSAPARVIAKALQDYGCLIGDNSGAGNRLKLELNEAAWNNLGLTYDALASIPWSDWEFIQGGYKP